MAQVIVASLGDANQKESHEEASQEKPYRSQPVRPFRHGSLSRRTCHATQEESKAEKIGYSVLGKYTLSCIGTFPFNSAILSFNSAMLLQVLATPISIQICSTSFLSPNCPLSH